MSCASGPPVAGAPAPSWCKGGGWTTSRKPGGFVAPTGVHADDAHFHVADQYNNNVQRFSLDGAFAGWKGVIATPPTSGDAGCTTATPGTFTPGWCMGGAFDNTPGNDGLGRLDGPQHVAGDQQYLYIADASNHRVLRVSK
jgi:hypothetical protein